MADFTTTGLLASIRRRGAIPSTAVTGTQDSDLLTLATEELQLRLSADLVGMREEYFARNSDVAISGTSYRIPTRALGGAVRLVQLLDSGSVAVQDLPRIELERVPEYRYVASLCGFTVEGNNLILVPAAVTTAVYLRMKYLERPSELISSGFATITVIAGNVITTSAAHGFTTSSVLDLVRATPGFESMAIDQTPTAAAGSSLTFTSLPSTLAVGDYVCPAQQAPVPQIPREYHSILAQRVAVTLLEAGLGQMGEVQPASAKLGQMEAAAGILASPRTKGHPRKIINRFSALGRRRTRGPGVGVF